MQYKKINEGYGYVVVLDKGEKLIETLTRFCEKEKVQSAFFVGIGGLSDTTLGFYDMRKKEYQWHEYPDFMELVSMTGNITLFEDKPFLHIHLTLGTPDMKIIGGHLKETTVAATCEIFIHLTNGANMKRLIDSKTGLKLIHFD